MRILHLLALVAMQRRLHRQVGLEGAAVERSLRLLHGMHGSHGIHVPLPSTSPAVIEHALALPRQTAAQQLVKSTCSGHASNSLLGQLEIQ